MVLMVVATEHAGDHQSTSLGQQGRVTARETNGLCSQQRTRLRGTYL